MNILITNDDGIYGEGLINLIEKLRLEKDYKLYVVAPDRERSGKSHSITIFEPLMLKDLGQQTYTLNGTPADCVKIALDGFLKDKIDLVLSGINSGPNMGIDVYYSGTVGAAREAVFHSVPSIAFSIDGYTHEKEFESSAEYAVKIVKQLCTLMDKNEIKELSNQTLYNVNFPNIKSDKVLGVQWTSLGQRVYQDQVIQRETPFGSSYFWIGGDLPTYNNASNTDFTAIENDFISITPLKIDTTCQTTLNILKSQTFEL